MLRKVSLAALLLAETVFSASLFAFPSLTIKSAFENSVKTKKANRKPVISLDNTSSNKPSSAWKLPVFDSDLNVTGEMEFGRKKPKSEPPKKPSAYEEFLKGAKKHEGLFTIYEKNKKFYLEIRPDQLHRNYLYTAKLERGTGEKLVYSSWLQSSWVWYFRRVADQIQLVKRNTAYRAQSDTPIGEAVRASFPDSILAATDLAVDEHPQTHYVLIDMARIFLSDLEDMRAWLGRAYQSGFSLETNTSFFEDIQSFPKNIEILLTLSFGGSSDIRTRTIPDTRNVNIGLRYSLSDLPRDDFRPRRADERVGYFTEDFEDFNKPPQEETSVHLITKWRLEKANPKLAISPVKQPVVLYLDKNIPEKFRDAIKAGVLAWNPAFERIGFKDAIVVRQMSADANWKAGDIRYNMIRWYVGADASMAIGPSQVNPLTGEIYHASISIADVFGRPGILLDYLSSAKATAKTAVRSVCNSATHIWREALFAMAGLRVKGELTSQEQERIIADILTHVTAHEVGHILGLRHNFAASAVFSLDDINKGKTNGLVSSSVMDYLPYAPWRGSPQNSYFQKAIGPYDYWAIEYGYKPAEGSTAKERSESVKEIAQRAAKDPALYYATDEDLSRNDPKVATDDLGNDPLAFSKRRVELAKDILQSIEKQGFAGYDAKKLRNIFYAALNQYFGAVENVSRYVGGVRYFRHRLPEEGTKTPFEPVSRQDQIKAMQFLENFVWGPGALEFPSALTRRLKLYESAPFAVDTDQILRNLYELSLEKVYAADTLKSMKINASMTSRKSGVFTSEELFGAARRSIWRELDRGSSKISSERRLLQQIYLGKLVELVKQPPENVPFDTQALARSDLESIAHKIDEILKRRSLDPATRVHLQDIKAKIRQSLFPSR